MTLIYTWSPLKTWQSSMPTHTILTQQGSKNQPKTPASKGNSHGITKDHDKEFNMLHMAHTYPNPNQASPTLSWKTYNGHQITETTGA
jgi:hypothetical protein